MNENDDPIVAETRAAGTAFFQRFGYDMRAALEALRRRSEEQGRAVVALAPTAPATPVPTKRAVG